MLVLLQAKAVAVVVAEARSGGGIVAHRKKMSSFGIIKSSFEACQRPIVADFSSFRNNIKCILKSINLQYITLGCLDNGTNKLSTKSLMFQVFFLYTFFYRLMPYPCSPFYADIKSDIRFDVRLWNSFHVKLYHKILIWYQNLWYD